MTNCELIKLIEKRYGFELQGLKLMRAGGTKTFQVDANQKKYFLKLVPEAFSSTVINSLDVLNHLKFHNFMAPRVILTTEGSPSVLIDYDSSKKVMVMFDYIEGQEIDQDICWASLGEVIGKFHNVMGAYTGQLTHYGKAFFIDRYVTILEKMHYKSEGVSKYRDYGNYLWDQVKDLPVGYCHGDLYTGNLIKDCEGNIHILDFDTSCLAFPIYDIAILCNATDYFKFEEADFYKTLETYKEFLNGYLKQRHLNEKEKVSFFDLVSIYHYQLQATIIEINGLDCVDHGFVDKQWEWLMKWKEQQLHYFSK